MTKNEIAIDAVEVSNDPSLLDLSKTSVSDNKKPRPNDSRTRKKRSSDDTVFEVLKVTSDLEIYERKVI